MSIRTERVREKIKFECARIIQSELKDPRLGFVTVIRVDLTHDFREAKVHVSIYAEREAEVRKVFRMLEDARGFIQRTVGSRLDTRVTPALTFVLDKSAEQSVKISALLDNLKQDRETREAAQKTGGDAPLEGSADLADSGQAETDDEEEGDDDDDGGDAYAEDGDESDDADDADDADKTGKRRQKR